MLEFAGGGWREVGAERDHIDKAECGVWLKFMFHCYITHNKT